MKGLSGTEAVWSVGRGRVLVVQAKRPPESPHKHVRPSLPLLSGRKSHGVLRQVEHGLDLLLHGPNRGVRASGALTVLDLTVLLVAHGLLGVRYLDFG